MPKCCGECRFCLFQDEGYSNYTVENTVFHCMKKVHPDGEFDRFYGEDKRLEFAECCPQFEAGSAISLDVEREDMADLTDDQRQLLASYEQSA